MNYLPASMAALANLLTDRRSDVAVLIRSQNGGSDSRYAYFEAFGDDVVEALIEDDFAFALYDTVEEATAKVEEARSTIESHSAGLVSAEIWIFQTGRQIEFHEINLG